MQHLYLRMQGSFTEALCSSQCSDIISSKFLVSWPKKHVCFSIEFPFIHQWHRKTKPNKGKLYVTTQDGWSNVINIWYNTKWKVYCLSLGLFNSTRVHPEVTSRRDQVWARRGVRRCARHLANGTETAAQQAEGRVRRRSMQATSQTMRD